MWVVVVGRAALRVDRSAPLPMWIGVCASVTQSFALCNPAKSIAVSKLRANAQGAPDEPNGYVQRAGHKGMRWVIY